MNAILLLLCLAVAPPENAYRLTVAKVYDGDTITADVALGFQVTLSAQSVRLAGYDAWEISRTRQTVQVTDEEIERGRLAKAALAELLGRYPDRVYLRPEGSGRGAYNRLQGWLVIYPRAGPEIDVAEYMKTRGHDRGTDRN